MNDTNNGMSCFVTCWLIAAAAGVLLGALMMILGGIGFTGAIFLGVILFVIAGAFLSTVFCNGKSAPEALGQSASLAPSAVQGSTSAAASNAQASRSTSTASHSAPVAGETAGVTAGHGTAGLSAGGAAAATTAPAAPATPASVTPKAAAPKAKSAMPAPDVAAEPVSAGSKPELLSEARAGGPDDLKQIKGVGPKMEGMLHRMGVYHFDQVASWSPSEVQWVDQNLEGFKGRVSRDEWVSQAKVLAEGGTTEFSSKVKKGGVY